MSTEFSVQSTQCAVPTTAIDEAWLRRVGFRLNASGCLCYGYVQADVHAVQTWNVQLGQASRMYRGSVLGPFTEPIPTPADRAEVVELCRLLGRPLEVCQVCWEPLGDQPAGASPRCAACRRYAEEYQE